MGIPVAVAKSSVEFAKQKRVARMKRSPLIHSKRSAKEFSSRREQLT